MVEPVTGVGVTGFQLVLSIIPLNAMIAFPDSPVKRAGAAYAACAAESACSEPERYVANRGDSFQTGRFDTDGAIRSKRSDSFQTKQFMLR